MQQPVCVSKRVGSLRVCVPSASNAARALQLGTTHGIVTALSRMSVAAHVFALHDWKAQHREGCICRAKTAADGSAFIVLNLILTLSQIGWLQWPASVTPSTHFYYYCGCLLSCVTHSCHCSEASLLATKWQVCLCLFGVCLQEGIVIHGVAAGMCVAVCALQAQTL